MKNCLLLLAAMLAIFAVGCASSEQTADPSQKSAEPKVAGEGEAADPKASGGAMQAATEP
jgi:hypothetical protein